MIARSTFQTSDSHKIFESMNQCDCIETTEKTRSPSMSSSGYSSMGSDPNTPDFAPTPQYHFQLSPSAEPYYPKGSPTRIFYSTKQPHVKHSPKPPKVLQTDLHLMLAFVWLIGSFTMNKINVKRENTHRYVKSIFFFNNEWAILAYIFGCLSIIW